ncbi:MAG: TauD/TfdA family dioxygenase [Pseudomonadota bacterium]
MTETLRTPVAAPVAWKASDYLTDTSWIFPLSDTHRDELNAATAVLKSKGIGPLEFTKEDFPLPTLGPQLAELLEDIEYGRGFALLRGLNVADYDLETLRVLYWGLGTHLGRVVSQNSQGDLLGIVTDMEDGRFAAGGYYDQGVRGHRTNAYLEPHSDSCDVVGLMCVRPAKSGGFSQICSSMAIYNDILENRPEYVEPLTEGFRFDLVGKGRTANEISNNRIPVYSFFEGILSCRFNKRQIELGAEKAGQPLSKLQQDAVDYVRDLSMREDFLLPMDFRPGDIQLLNNHCTLHSRTGYEDHEDAAKRRYLLRLWLNIPNGRPLAPAFADRLNSGDRGGVTKRL